MPGDKYLIYIRGNTLDEATEEALHLAYWLLTRALLEHRRQGRNGDYEAFAVEVPPQIENRSVMPRIFLTHSFRPVFRNRVAQNVSLNCLITGSVNIPQYEAA